MYKLRSPFIVNPVKRGWHLGEGIKELGMVSPEFLHHRVAIQHDTLPSFNTRVIPKHVKWQLIKSQYLWNHHQMKKFTNLLTSKISAKLSLVWQSCGRICKTCRINKRKLIIIWREQKMVITHSSTSCIMATVTALSPHLFRPPPIHQASLSERYITISVNIM